MNGKIVLMLCVAGLLVSGGIAASTEGRGNAHTQSVITVEAFRGQAITDLLIKVSPDIQVAKKIQVKAYYTNGTIKFTRNFDNAVSAGGVILIQFDDLMRGERVDARVQGDTGSGVEASTVVKLRPDLVVSINTVSSVLVGENLPVSVTITENNGDMGSEAVLSLMNGDSVLNSTVVSLNAGSVANAVFSTSFASRGEHNLSVRIMNSTPADYDETNNVQYRVVNAVAPDIAITDINAPSGVTAGEMFEVLATVSELYNEVGASVTVALFEGSTILDSRTIDLRAGGNTVNSLNGTLYEDGLHNLQVKIINTVPIDNNPANNEQPFAVQVQDALQPELPEIISWSNSKTNDASLVIAIDTSDSVRFNATSNQTITTWNWYMDDMNQNNNNDNLITGFTGDNHTIKVSATNSNGTSNMVVWTIAVANASIPLESMHYASKYSYKNTTINTSHYVTSEGHEDKSEVLEKRENDALSFTASSTRVLSFPIDRVYISIANEAGEVIVYQETGLVSGGNGIFTKYYPDNNAVLTLQINENGTTVSLESKSNSTIKRSKGYLYWWFKPSQEWDVTTTSGSGRLIRAKDRLQVRVELEDSSCFIGGTALTNLTSNNYPWSWTDNSDGWFEQQRSVWTYSGKSSGDTGT